MTRQLVMWRGSGKESMAALASTLRTLADNMDAKCKKARDSKPWYACVVTEPSKEIVVSIVPYPSETATEEDKE